MIEITFPRNDELERDERFAKLLAYIPEGFDDRVDMKTLAHVLGIDNRTLRSWIERARREGAVIAGNPSEGGYYIPTTDDELKGYVYQARARLSSGYAALRPASDFLDALEGEEVNRA